MYSICKLLPRMRRALERPNLPICWNWTHQNIPDRQHSARFRKSLHPNPQLINHRSEIFQIRVFPCSILCTSVCKYDQLCVQICSHLWTNIFNYVCKFHRHCIWNCTKILALRVRRAFYVKVAILSNWVSNTRICITFCQNLLSVGKYLYFCLKN